jgi:hypothetical protein
MAFRPNYNQQRAERNRAKQAKKEEKLRRQQELTALRKSGNPEGSDSPDTPTTDEDKQD